MRTYPIEFMSYALPAQFPLAVYADYEVSDREVTKLHVHDCLQVGYCQEGSGVYIIGDQFFPFGAGDVYVIPAQQVHFVQGTRGRKCVWTWVFLDPLRLIAGLPSAAEMLRCPGYGHPGIMRVRASAEARELAALVQGISAEFAGKAFGYQTVIQALVLALVTRLYRFGMQRRQTPRPSEGGRLARIAPALRYVAANCGSAIRNEDLARACAMGVRNFNRAFRAVLGTSPQEYLCRARMAKACADLRSSGATISRVALANGFQSVSSFNRAFRAMVGMSPRQWRRGG